MPADYNMGYADNELGKFMYFVADDLPKMCKAIFPFSDKREDNFIGGLSMGAAGCQKIALKYPEKYAAVLGMYGGSVSKVEANNGRKRSEKENAVTDANVAAAK